MLTEPPTLMLTLTRRLARFAVAGTLLAASASVHAHNLSFLNDTPITYMKERDRAALNHAAQVALDTKKDGESLAWNNDGTGNPVHVAGTVTPRDTVKTGEKVCRRVTLTANAKGQTQTWTPTACKEGHGQWKIKKQ
jgi:surface antigen